MSHGSPVSGNIRGLLLRGPWLRETELRSNSLFLSGVAASPEAAVALRGGVQGASATRRSVARMATGRTGGCSLPVRELLSEGHCRFGCGAAGSREHHTGGQGKSLASSDGADACRAFLDAELFDTLSAQLTDSSKGGEVTAALNSPLGGWLVTPSELLINEARTRASSRSTSASQSLLLCSKG